ncbi:unnamed protein product [Brassica napus]|nr:unnamed protein product [Brassica napus]
MIRTMKSPSPLCEPRYSSPKPNNDRVALDTSLDLPPKSLSSTILMEDGQNIQKWHPNNLTEDSMKCLNFIYDRLLRTTRVMELEKSGPVSRSAHFFLSSKSFRVDNAASCLSKSMNLVSYKESRQQDPYGIFDVEASLARDIGPYKNLVIFTSSSMDSKCISSSSSVSLIRKLSGFESVEPSSKARVLDQHVQCVYYACKNISANTIEHCILRKPANSTMSKDREEMIIRKLYGIETTDPNIIFALSCGTRSSPAYLQASVVVTEAKRVILPEVVVTEAKRVILPELLVKHAADFVGARADSSCGEMGYLILIPARKEMGSKWRKAKLALGLNLCLYVPKTLEESSSLSRRSNDAVSLSPVTVPRPTTPTPSSSGLRLPRSISISSSKKTCAICLTAMKAGQGHAIFTAECSHSFHFHCITTNVQHGNQICPVCRAKWNEVPLQIPNAKSKPIVRPRDDAWMTIPPRRSSLIQPSPRPERLRPVSMIFNNEPAVFNDDEALELQDRPAESTKPGGVSGKLEVKTYPEISEVVRSVSFKDFSVLINLKAPPVSSSSSSSSSRAPVDLVTVLDVSGSMAGTKLALLKRAMGFVIQNLGPFDRLSVISFSSTARRSFPLRLMTETGKQEALQAVNSLVSNGGTNIAEGLMKGAKVLIERRFKNSVSSIVLLSDGQDTYTMTSPTGSNTKGADYKTLLPKEVNRIPVHAFGFGADHDASLMHSIAENSGGTFSFIESETVIQDAFAQCIGGLLSVMVQELRVKIECVHPMLKIGSVKAGSYRFDSRTGSIEVGDLYAEEERNFLVNLDVPVLDGVLDTMSLLKVGCVYRDPVTKETVDLSNSGEVKILRPVLEGRPVVSVEVDRQKIRLRAAEAISEARVLAERGDLTGAVSVLETCRGVLSETVSGRAGDALCVSLCAELKETQERMASRQVYESSGRAYVLAGLSSHSWQRATARGDMSDTTTMSYQTQSMVDMVNLSQTMTFGCPRASSNGNSSSNPNPSPSARRKLRQALTFPARPRAR